MRIAKAAFAVLALPWSAQAFAMIKEGNCYDDDDGNTLYCEPVDDSGATYGGSVVVIGTNTGDWWQDSYNQMLQRLASEEHVPPK